MMLTLNDEHDLASLVQFDGRGCAGGRVRVFSDWWSAQADHHDGSNCGINLPGFFSCSLRARSARFSAISTPKQIASGVPSTTAIVPLRVLDAVTSLTLCLVAFP
jgi:hypothetical protein